MENSSCPNKSTINALLFEIKNYRYGRTIEDQKTIMSFLDYENYTLYHDLVYLAQNTELFKNEILKCDNDIATLQNAIYERDLQIAISQLKCISAEEINRQNTININKLNSDNTELIKICSSNSKNISKLKTKLKTKLNKKLNKKLKLNDSYHNKYIQILNKERDDLETENIDLLNCYTALQTEHTKLLNYCASLQTENTELLNLCNSSQTKNKKLKLDKNTLNHTIIDLQIDLCSSKVDIESLQEDVEEYKSNLLLSQFDLSNSKLDLLYSQEESESYKSLSRLIIEDFQEQIEDLTILNNHNEQEIDHRDNDISWLLDERVKSKHEIMRLNNAKADLQKLFNKKNNAMGWILEEYNKSKREIMRLNNVISDLTISNNHNEQEIDYRDNDIAWLLDENTKSKRKIMRLNNVVSNLETLSQGENNSIEWFLEEHVKSKREILRLNNIILELEEKNKSIAPYQTEFKTINSLFTKKEIEVVELKKQLKILQRDNSQKHNSLLLNESTIKTLKNKLETQLHAVQIKTVQETVQETSINVETVQETSTDVEKETHMDVETIQENITECEPDWAIY